ncbi:MAG: hypothetical protein K0S39_3838 [Paenibacillus sp.]|jgi:hypothetical protein|nr:hypothetical protein [Paenibacillus sp.]
MNKKQDLEEFSHLTSLLINAELDNTANKDQIFNRLKTKIEKGTIQPNYTEKDDLYMKKNNWKSVAVIASVLVCLCGAFSTTSYAQEMLQSILGRFQIGNMEITQYDKELPDLGLNRTFAKEGVNDTKRIEGKTPLSMTLKEARGAMGVNFPAPAWLSDNYEFTNCVAHGDHMVEVQYKKEGEFISLLISKGVKNGISTTDEVKTETIGGKAVYFANGIVIWEHEGFTYELYQMAEENFNVDTIGKIIQTLSTEN